MTIRSKRPIFLGLGVGLVLLGLAFAAGWLAGGLRQAQLAGFPLVSEIWVLVRDHYSGTLPDGPSLGRSMGRGLVQALGDPYSVIVDPAARELETDQLTGSYGGIGADLIRDAGGLLHLVPYPDGPAARGGIVEGDILLSIDGEELTPTVSMEDVTALLRGAPGSTVVVVVKPSDALGSLRQLRLVRETFSLPSVSSYLLPDDPTVVVVRITLFSQMTPTEVDRALESATARGATVGILDVRGTPGGLLESAVDTARLFLKDGTVASEQRADGSLTHFRVERQGRWSLLPVAVIVDGGTASAAEIVAGSLQQRGRAIVLGMPTVGKGTVQSIFALSDGSSLHLTTAVWTLPDGHSLPSGGLAPDIVVDSAAPEAALRLAAQELQDQGPGT
ncbi:MAG TPA: S41 family peptidase [Anaerolineales bacterium]|nr:S41 family peptidase [Anaerolineales bacterium]